MSVAGKVCTGFSLPYVADYSAEGGTITYANCMKLARGVDVSIEPTGSENIFYADNVAAETANQFTGGTLNLTVDGLLELAEKKISGLGTKTDGWYAYDDTQASGYFGVGFIGRYMSGGVTTYVPYVLVKVKFDPLTTSASTQEAEISWQTQALTAQIMRGDDTNHTWKFVGIDYETESAAESALQDKLGYEAPVTG